MPTKKTPKIDELHTRTQKFLDDCEALLDAAELRELLDRLYCDIGGRLDAARDALEDEQIAQLERRRKA